MSEVTELPDWNGKFPKRYNCQNPCTKCEFCCHKDPCVPDDEDEFRKEFDEFTAVDKAALAIWLVLIVGAAAWLYFIKF